MSDRAKALHARYGRPWQAGEREALPWQERQKQFPTDPAYSASLDPSYTPQNLAGGVSDKEYARRAAEYFAKHPRRYGQGQGQ